MIKAVIFDMDGVIADSEPLHMISEIKVMAGYGVKISTKELHKYVGTTAKFMFEEFIKKYRLKTTFKKMYAQKRKILLALYKKELKPMKGVVPLIKALHKRKIRLALASSSRRKIVYIVLKKIKIKKYFEVITCGDDIKKSKPNPEIFLKTAAKLKLKPQACLVIEDAHVGVLAAKKAKMKCIGYQNKHSGNQDLKKANIIIKDFTKNISNFLRADAL